MSEAAVRRARPEDHAAVAAFTANTFEWGDYVAEAFPGWLALEEAAVFVATDADDTAVAVARVVQLSPREIWMHAARVHPDHRRQGLGSAMNESGLAWGRERGAVVAGLMTDVSNVAAQGQVASMGYRSVATWFYANRTIDPGTADPAGDGLDLEEHPQPLAAAPSVDIEPAYLTWASSELATAGHDLIPRGWSMRRMSVDDVATAARDRTLYEGPAGWSIIERDDGRVWVPWLVTIPDDAYSFVRAITARVAADGCTDVSLLLPRVPWLESAAERAGFSVHPHIVWQIEIV